MTWVFVAKGNSADQYSVARNTVVLGYESMSNTW